MGVSGVLSVVAAGLYSGWRDPVRMDAETRQEAYGVWSLLLFWLNGIAFVLLGLQFPALFAAVSHAVHGPPSPRAHRGGRGHRDRCPHRRGSFPAPTCRSCFPACARGRPRRPCRTCSW